MATGAIAPTEQAIPGLIGTGDLYQAKDPEFATEWRRPAARRGGRAAMQGNIG